MKWLDKYQDGGDTQRIDSILGANKHLGSVQRLYERDGESIQLPGEEGTSTHFYEQVDNFAVPGVDMVDGKLQRVDNSKGDRSEDHGIKFDSPEKALWFTENYKKGTGVLPSNQDGGWIDNMQDGGAKKRIEDGPEYTDLEMKDLTESVETQRPVENIPGSVVKQRTDFNGTFLSPIATKFLEDSNLLSEETGSDSNRIRNYGDVYDLYRNYFGQPLESEAVHISNHRPTNEKDPSSVYYAVKDSIFRSNILDIANDMSGKHGRALAKGKTVPADGYMNSKANWASSQEKKDDAYDTRRASTAIGRFQLSKGKDEKGEYLSYYDVFDATSDGGPTKNTFGAAKPFEVYDRIYLDEKSPHTYKEKRQDGGIVKDDQGYWNPENHGKVVEIDSNNITMKGINQPLLGVSDTGDTKLMKPGEEYKFKGKKVTEYPLQDGGWLDKY